MHFAEFRKTQSLFTHKEFELTGVCGLKRTSQLDSTISLMLYCLLSPYSCVSSGWCKTWRWAASLPPGWKCPTDEGSRWTASAGSQTQQRSYHIAASLLSLFTPAVFTWLQFWSWPESGGFSGSMPDLRGPRAPLSPASQRDGEVLTAAEPSQTTTTGLWACTEETNSSLA